VKKVIIGDKINIDGNILTTTEAKAKLEELIKDPNIKKAVEAKMKQYE
jgi:hypothetical protein